MRSMQRYPRSVLIEGGILELDNKAGYDVGPLDLTNCSRLRIEIDPVCVVRGSMMVAGAQAPVFDLSYSHEVEIHGGSVFAGTGDPWSPTPSHRFAARTVLHRGQYRQGENGKSDRLVQVGDRRHLLQVSIR
jgi:hypothetical protein